MSIATKCTCGKSPYFCIGGEGCRWNNFEFIAPQVNQINEQGSGEKGLTRMEAIQVMNAGKKVTHGLFALHNWVTMDGFDFVFDNGEKYNSNEMWRHRTGYFWETGWRIVEPVSPVEEGNSNLSNGKLPIDWAFNRVRENIQGEKTVQNIRKAIDVTLKEAETILSKFISGEYKAILPGGVDYWQRVVDELKRQQSLPTTDLPKERCEYELLVEKYFGFPDTVKAGDTFTVNYAQLVDLVCAAHQKFASPIPENKTSDRKGEKTALGLLIEKIQSAIDNPNSPESYTIYDTLFDAKELLEKEKKQIIDAFDAGFKDSYPPDSKCAGEAKSYFTSTFTNQIEPPIN